MTKKKTKLYSTQTPNTEEFLNDLAYIKDVSRHTGKADIIRSAVHSYRRLFESNKPEIKILLQK
jgi:hypothetical protein